MPEKPAPLALSGSGPMSSPKAPKRPRASGRTQHDDRALLAKDQTFPADKKKPHAACLACGVLVDVRADRRRLHFATMCGSFEEVREAHIPTVMMLLCVLLLQKHGQSWIDWAADHIPDWSVASLTGPQKARALRDGSDPSTAIDVDGDASPSVAPAPPRTSAGGPRPPAKSSLGLGSSARGGAGRFDATDLQNFAKTHHVPSESELEDFAYAWSLATFSVGVPAHQMGTNDDGFSPWQAVIRKINPFYAKAIPSRKKIMYVTLWWVRCTVYCSLACKPE